MIPDLESLFPGYESQEKAFAWTQLKQRYTFGDPVRGVVVGKSPFGAWVDLGVGFPGLLEIAGIKDVTPEDYQQGRWCPIKSTIDAFIGDFNDTLRQIRVWQVRSPKP